MRAGDNDGASRLRMRTSHITHHLPFFPFSYFRQSQRLGPHVQRRVNQNEKNEGGISAVSTHTRHTNTF